uniref:Uncharacterized protein n=1 Tax=Anguilla anguilla TaxID=7936 RepID=A0A0E9TLW6_ANGAN
MCKGTMGHKKEKFCTGMLS